MTDAPKIDTQAPERIKTILRNNLSGPTFFDAQVKAAHEDDLNRVSHLLANLSAAREAAAWIAGRDAAVGSCKATEASHNYMADANLPVVSTVVAKDRARQCANLADAIRDLTPPADASAALDRLIAERVREAVEAEREACAREADQTAQEAHAFADPDGYGVAVRIASIIRARACKEAM